MLSEKEVKYFAGKKILITGAFDGIGRALCIQLLPLCAKLYCLDHAEQKLEEFKQYCLPIKKIPQIHLVDVTDELAMARLLFEIEAQDGLDIVIANAGIKGTNSFLDFDSQLAKKVMAVNFGGLCNTILPVLPSMLKKRSGHIVGLSSMGVYRGMVKGAPYFCSKSAIAVFLESLRLEVKPLGVRVTTIFPGYVKTNMTKENTVPLIFMLETEAAAKKILSGMARGKSSVAFPWPMRILTFFNRLLPDFIYDFLACRLAGKSR